MGEKEGVLITGGSGFIGTHLIKRLLREGLDVYALDNRPFQGKLSSQNGLSQLQADITNDSWLDQIGNKLEKRVRFVVHLAALGNQPDISEGFYQKVNVNGTINVFKMTHNICCPYFIFASSVDAAGPCEKNRIPINESFECRPVSLYGKSKLEGEKKIMSLAQELSIQFSILRFGNVYGENNLSFIKYIADALKTRNLYFLNRTEGIHMWHPVFIDDVLDCIVNIMKKELFYNQVYFLTGDEMPKNQHLIEIISRELGYSLEEISLRSCKEKIFFRLRQLVSTLTKGPLENRSIFKAYSNQKAAKELGFSPHTSLKEGIPRVVKWAQKQELI